MALIGSANLEHTGGGKRDEEITILLATQIDANTVAAAAAQAILDDGDSDAVVATVDGLTTGLIPAAARFVTVTSSVATKQISLPAAIGGKDLQILGPANGCELISVVAGDKVNTVVVGATNEAALVAGTLYTLHYDGVDNWIMDGLDGLGAVETPVIPDTMS